MPNLVMNSLVDAVKATGNLGIIGVFVPKDPGAEDDLAKKGQLAFDFGKFWFKGQKMGTGQCNVKAYNRRLRNLIHHGKANPSCIVSHELPLAEAPNAYQHFDERTPGWIKSFFIQPLLNCDQTVAACDGPAGRSENNANLTNSHERRRNAISTSGWHLCRRQCDGRADQCPLQRSNSLRDPL